MLTPSSVASSEMEQNKAQPPSKPSRKTAQGILPQLGVLLRLPESYRLYNPQEPRSPLEPIEYARPLPIFGEKAINKGYSLPLPFGISIIGVDNTQDQNITDLNISLGKGVAPPEDGALLPIAAVNIDTTSSTRSPQLKADMWLFPFLNIFTSLGKATGDADVNVVINMADAEQICIPNPIPILPPICSDNTFSGSFLLPIQSKIDRTTGTVGFNGVYGIGSWFFVGSAAYTDSWGDRASNVDSANASIRAGRRLFLGNGTMLSPFFGVNYLNINTRVQGLTSLADAFPDGDGLYVRYDVQLNNTDDYAGFVGLALGFKKGWGMQFEFSKSNNSKRIVMSADYRF